MLTVVEVEGVRVKGVEKTRNAIPNMGEAWRHQGAALSNLVFLFS